MMSTTEIPYIAVRGKRHCFSEPEVMGILNATPDSFFADSRKQTEAEIAQRADEIVAEGGTIIDIGACSTRPGSEPVTAEEEMRRMRNALVTVRRNHPDAILSIDTFRPEVAQMSVEEFGADIINDVSGGTEEIFRLAARLQVTYLLMSSDPTAETVGAMFDRNIAALNRLGCDDIILDPGYGFGKDVAQNYGVLRRQRSLRRSHYPLLAGVSRKRMVWQLLGCTPEEALNGTTVVNAVALQQGADILRVHDVKQAKETIKIIKECSCTSE